MKIAGVVIILMCSAFAGISFNSYKRKQINYISMLIIISEKMIVMLEHSLPDTNEIVLKLKEDDRLSDFDFSLNKIPLDDALSRSMINDFFNSIGKYDADTQLRLADEFSSECRMLKEKYQQEYDKHHRMYISLGVLGATIFSLLII